MVAKELLNDKVKELKFIEKIEIFIGINNGQSPGDRYNSYYINKKYFKIKHLCDTTYSYSYDIEFHLENNDKKVSLYDSDSLIKKIIEIEKSILKQDESRTTKFGNYPSPREIYDIAMENRRTYKDLRDIIHNHYSTHGEKIPNYWRQR